MSSSAFSYICTCARHGRERARVDATNHLVSTQLLRVRAGRRAAHGPGRDAAGPDLHVLCVVPSQLAHGEPGAQQALQQLALARGGLVTELQPHLHATRPGTTWTPEQRPGHTARLCRRRQCRHPGRELSVRAPRRCSRSGSAMPAGPGYQHSSCCVACRRPREPTEDHPKPTDDQTTTRRPAPHPEAHGADGAEGDARGDGRALALALQVLALERVAHLRTGRATTETC
jgi:hypothetical protein